MNVIFPVPYRSIDCYIEARDREQLSRMAVALLDCGHPHNFGVQLDGWRIHTTSGGADCIQRALAAGKS